MSIKLVTSDSKAIALNLKRLDFDYTEARNCLKDVSVHEKCLF